MKTTKAIFVLTAMTLQTPMQSFAAGRLSAGEAIENTANAHAKAVLAGDVAAVVAGYRQDAIEMPSCRPMLRGRAAIEQYYRGLFNGPVKITAFTFVYLETAAAGDFGYTAGTYKQKLVSNSGEAWDDEGKFMIIAKRDSGSWKAAYVIYNSDRPPAQPVGTAALPSPFPALMNYYTDMAGVWLIRFTWLLLGLGCIAAAWRLRSLPLNIVKSGIRRLNNTSNRNSLKAWELSSGQRSTG